MKKIELKIVSSLEKVMLDSKKLTPMKTASCLRNERYSIQLAYRAAGTRKIPCKLTITGEKEAIDVRLVGNVPVELTAYSDIIDEEYLSFKPGLYPDVLYPVETKEIDAMAGTWHSLWIIIDAAKFSAPGKKTYRFRLENKAEEVSEEVSFTLDVLGVELPEQKLIFTEWFHVDCIADLHNVKVFSPKHWELIEKYVKMAVKCGINMLLVPLFTPPLDTAIGGERKTVQLVGVEKKNGHYSFDFTLLKKYIALLQKHGIKYFEFSHLFTQWGAKATPKIVVTEDGVKKKMFGWKVSATSAEYRAFLGEFLPALKKLIYELNIAKQVYFHISDEPAEEHLESYSAARGLVYDELKEFKILDALSDLEFYQKGLIEIPVPCTNYVEGFLPLTLPERWTYYCCGEGKDYLSNRFLSMPSYRNRILGSQLYKFNMDGFLHWGFNFYYSQYSKRVINPYLVTDADGAFPSGDAFMVYPYKNTVIESLRAVVFYEGLQDMRALKLLEQYTSREEVLKVMEEALGCDLKFKTTRTNAASLLKLRETVNRLLANYQTEE